MLFILNDSLVLCDLRFFCNLSMGLMSLNNDLFFVDLILDFYGNKFMGYGLYVVDWYCIVIVVYSFFFDF